MTQPIQPGLVGEAAASPWPAWAVWGMGQRLWAFPALALVLLGAVGTACTAPAAPVASASLAPTYTVLVNQVFSNCTTRSCHGAAAPRGGLALTPELAYGQLVGVVASDRAAAAKGKLRVAPGKPEASYLYQKLTTPEAGEGRRMPDGDVPLSAAELEAVRAWIAAGAPRD